MLNNKTTILPDYTRYRFTALNPISKGKKDNTQTKIVAWLLGHRDTYRTGMRGRYA